MSISVIGHGIETFRKVNFITSCPFIFLVVKTDPVVQRFQRRIGINLCALPFMGISLPLLIAPWGSSSR